MFAIFKFACIEKSLHFIGDDCTGLFSAGAGVAVSAGAAGFGVLPFTVAKRLKPLDLGTRRSCKQTLDSRPSTVNATNGHHIYIYYIFYIIHIYYIYFYFIFYIYFIANNIYFIFLTQYTSSYLTF